MLAAAVAFEIDVRKNYDPDARARFGPPAMNISNVNPRLRIKVLGPFFQWKKPLSDNAGRRKAGPPPQSSAEPGVPRNLWRFWRRGSKEGFGRKPAEEPSHRTLKVLQNFGSHAQLVRPCKLLSQQCRMPPCGSWNATLVSILFFEHVLKARA